MQAPLYLQFYTSIYHQLIGLIFSIKFIAGFKWASGTNACDPNSNNVILKNKSIKVKY